MISAVAWVPKGAAAKEPIKYEMTPEEEQAIREAAEQEGVPRSQILFELLYDSHFYNI